MTQEPFKQFSSYEHKETITSSDTKVSISFLDNVPTTSPLEISDEEIEKAAKEKHVGLSRDVANYRGCFVQGAKWYREQLKKK